MNRPVLLCLCAAVIAITCSPAFCYTLDFEMINNTNQPIVAFMASRTDNKFYNRFNNVNVPPNGGKERFLFNDGEVSGDACYVDMKIEFRHGGDWTFSDINLCSTRTLTIDVDDDGRVTYSAE